MGAHTCISSILKNVLPETKLEFHLLGYKLKLREQEKLVSLYSSDSVRVHFYEVGLSGFRLFQLGPSSSRVPYLRLLLPKLLPQALTSILYVDCDMVFEHDISQLWVNDFQGKWLYAVPEWGIQLPAKERGLNAPDTFVMEITPETEFNSGLMMINLSLWRAHQVVEKVKQVLWKKRFEFPFNDQQGLNYVCKGHWGSLDLRWNWMSHVNPKLLNYHQPQKEGNSNELPFAIHYVSLPKPWQTNCRALLRNRFYHYLNLTPYRGWQPQPQSLPVKEFREQMSRANRILREPHLAFVRWLRRNIK